MIDWIKIDKNTKLEHKKRYLLCTSKPKLIDIAPDSLVHCVDYDNAWMPLSDFSHYAHINLPE